MGRTLQFIFQFAFIALTTTFLFSCKGADGGFAPAAGLPSLSADLTISPAAVTVAVLNLQTFTATGGAPPYTYSIFSGAGSVLQTTGAFTAPGVPGSTVVRVTDKFGKFSDAIVTVNPALQISPTSYSITVTNSYTFTATGGVNPLVFSKVSGIGTIDPSTGLYTAPSSPGSATVRVTDALGNTSTATIGIFGALGISPNNYELAVSNTNTFTAAGGSAPYTFSVLSGGGTINASTGVYTAPATAGTAKVRVTDNLGSTADAQITIDPALTISPVSQTTYINSTITFSSAGGVQPVSYSIIAGSGSIDSNTGDYTAPASIGTSTVRVTDAVGNTADSNVTITSPISISPSTYTLAVNNTVTFSGVGGTPPYVFSRVSGTGTVNSSTGVYTAPASAGSAIIRVTDSLGATADASVAVNAALAISPATQTMGINVTLNYSSTGGVVPYTYSIFSGGGSVNASTGVFTAPATPGTTVVRVTDAVGNTSNSTVTVTSGLSISPASTTLAVNNTQTFVGANGSTPYTYSVLSGGGTINSSTGVYTAPATSGTAVVRVTSSLGSTADATVTINPALAISPATKTLAVNNTFTFTATGGVSPYTYSITAGGGTINSSSGLFTAPAAAGSVTVRVTDGLNNTSNATVTINAALAISPTTATIASTGTKTFTASGGVSPYAYSIVSGPGSINSSTGVYTGASAGSVTVRVTDSLSNTSDAALTVTGPLTVSPTSAYVVTDSDYAISAAGGIPPYTYSIVGGTPGQIDSSAGIYTADPTTGTATLRTTDSTGATADMTVTIYLPLDISPDTVTMGVGGSQTFTAAGGVGTRTFSVYSGGGTINSSTGAFTAPGTAGTTLIHVTDTIGNVVEATVSVVSALTITPQTLKLPVFSTMTFTSILGTAPYSYSVTSGTGTVNASTGLYTAASTAGTGGVRSTDAAANTSNATVTHIEPVEISSGAYHTCVRYNEGSVKCFGDGAYGQLGNGTTNDLGDATTEQGGNLPFVDLGTGRTATALATGFYHSCAMLDNGTVKCWGQNTYGQLGIGNANTMGDGANEMGDNLPAINLGTGRTATKIFAFGYVTCAILDNSATKCWGRNSYGQLGQGDITNRGTTAAQMGDGLLAINFGTGRTAVKLDGGVDFTCAQLDNATIKCFGRANNGQLGYENTNSIGDGAGEMGTALAAVNLGTGRTVQTFASGYSHTCALLDNNTVKCWGRNQSGQLGLGNTTTKGAAASTMGDSLTAVPFAGGFVPTQLVMGRQWGCGISSTNLVRCWGYNIYGQLMVGNTSSQGDGAGEVAALTNINFGTGVTITALQAGYYFGCVITSNKRIKCFGSALNGALLNASTTANLGDTAGELGDGLPFVNH